MSVRRSSWRAGCLSALLISLPSVVAGQSAPPGQQLANQAFRIEYDASGIRSLKRTNDIHDTDYIAANGRLGS